MKSNPLVSRRTSAWEPHLGHVRFRTAGAAVLVLFGVLFGGGTAWADMGQSPPPAYVIVQQAMSYLVNDSSATGTEDAVMKLDEALSAPTAAGVDLAEVRQARSALQAGDSATALTLLQTSISAAVANMKPAVGEETGTSVMAAPYSPSGPDGLRWVFLVLSVSVAIGGAVLASWLRPPEGLRDLSRDILGAQGLRHRKAVRRGNERGRDAR